MRERAGRTPTRRGIAAALVALSAVLTLPATAFAGSGLELRSGQLLAEVTADPFAITLTDEADGDVLRTRAGGTAAPDDPRARYGPLGYSYDLRQPVVNNAYLGYYTAGEAETLWFHGRRVISSNQTAGVLTLEVETNDPLGHRLEVRLEPAGDGGIAVSSRVAPGSGPLAGQERISGAAFEAGAGERFLGFGERSNAVDQTGNEVFNWAEEGPFSSGEGEALLRPLIPDFTFPSGPTATNFPIPWMLTSRGFGFLIDQTHRSRFRLGSEIADAWQAETETNNFRFVVFAGPEPADALRRYSAHTGRQPRPAPWIFGPWCRRCERPEIAAPVPGAERAGERLADLHPLPALRCPGGARAGRAGPRPLSPQSRLQGHHLFQPARLHRLPAGLRGGGCQRLLRPRFDRGALPALEPVHRGRAGL